ncbi:MAG: hypothetical protein WAX04_13075 [Oscillospiraceae bacterium]
MAKSVLACNDIGEQIVLGNLVEGLPLPENTDLIMKLTPEKLSFMTISKQEFEIDFSKVTLIDLKSDVEMEKLVQQSAPGMIIGAATFGLIGAMVGGRVKTKEKRIVNHFLIVNYQSDELKTIIIQTTKDWYNSASLVDSFKKLKPDAQPIKIQL